MRYRSEEQLTVATVAKLLRGRPTPVDLAALYEELGLKGPFELYGEDWEEFLTFYSSNPDRDFTQHVLGYIDERTLEVFVDSRLNPQRYRFIVAHELFHKQLGHCDYVLQRPGEAVKRHAEMEREASAHAVELLCPAARYTETLRDLTPVGRRSTIADIRRAAALFDVSLYTALRRHVENDAFSSALITFFHPLNYKGSSQVTMNRNVVMSKRWEAEQKREMAARPGSPLLVAGHSVLRIAANISTTFASLALDDRTESGEDMLRDYLEVQFGASADIGMTHRSVHILLSR